MTYRRSLWMDSMTMPVSMLAFLIRRGRLYTVQLPRQLYVHEHGVRVQLAGHQDAGLAVACNSDDFELRLGRKCATQQLAEERLVLDDQYSRRVVHWAVSKAVMKVVPGHYGKWCHPVSTW